MHSYHYTRITVLVNACICASALADIEAEMAQFATTVTTLSSILCSCFICSQCQSFLNPAEISKTEQIIRDNMFYPPLESNSSQNVSRKPLVFGLIMSFGGNFDSSSAVPGVRVALDHINNDSYLLPGYTLHYALSDSRVRFL